MSSIKKWFDYVLEPTGIKINGSHSFDPQIKDERFYKRVRRQGSLGLGESYINGWWECQALDEFFYRLLSVDIYQRVGLSWPLIINYLQSKLINMQALRRAFQIGEKHYDIGNDLFSRMLGQTMAYSCGYWNKAVNLDEAQKAKLDLICKKLNLQPGQTVLDIGCGWGSFARYAATNYHVKVVGLTVSKEQVDYGQKWCAGLPVEFRLQDYRLVNEKFNHVVSVGMIEHVGVKNYKTYMNKALNCLKPGGLFLLHTIGSLRSVSNTDPWTEKYIFPNGCLPSLRQLAAAVENKFVIEDIHNFGADYDKTLMSWHDNFIKSWPEIKDKYSDKFYRMWRYYLLSCAGSFRARHIQLWQIVMSAKGVTGGYESVR
jgi:cyclopropane-fatty-acyl-phospholipid synthase